MEKPEKRGFSISELAKRYSSSARTIGRAIEKLGIALNQCGKEKRLTDESELERLDAHFKQRQEDKQRQEEKKKVLKSSVPPPNEPDDVNPGSRDASEQPAVPVQPSNAPIVPANESELDRAATPVGEYYESEQKKAIERGLEMGEARATSTMLASELMYNHVLDTFEFRNPQNKEDVQQARAETDAKWAKRMEARDPKAFTESVMEQVRSRENDKV